MNAQPAVPVADTPFSVGGSTMPHHYDNSPDPFVLDSFSLDLASRATITGDSQMLERAGVTYRDVASLISSPTNG